jgi:hypothetical protein
MSLAVIEGKWFPNSNISVKPVFDFMAEVRRHVYGKFDYHYEMFNNSSSFRDAFARAIERKGLRNIYIAAHGDKNAIYGYGDDQIDLEQIAEIVDLTKNKGSKIDGIFFGSCEFGSHENLEYILSKAHLSTRWVAGYDYDAEIVNGTFEEAQFFSDYFDLIANGRPTLGAIRDMIETGYFEEKRFATERKINLVYYDGHHNEPYRRL